MNNFTSTASFSLVVAVLVLTALGTMGCEPDPRPYKMAWASKADYERDQEALRKAGDERTIKTIAETLTLCEKVVNEKGKIKAMPTANPTQIEARDRLFHAYSDLKEQVRHASYAGKLAPCKPALEVDTDLLPGAQPPVVENTKDGLVAPSATNNF